MVFCVVGSFALNNTMFDVWVMLIFGVIGFLLERGKFPLGPFVIGFVLAPLAEAKAAQRPDDHRRRPVTDRHPNPCR